MARNYATLSKIVGATLGNPKAIHNLPEGQTELLLGRVIGTASDIVMRTVPLTGEQVLGIKGEFEATPADETKDVVQAPVLWLPCDGNELVAKMLYNEKGERIANAVDIAFDIAVFKASNAAGYSWKLKPLFAPAADNPMERLRARIAEATTQQAQLAAPKGKEKAA